LTSIPQVHTGEQIVANPQTEPLLLSLSETAKQLNICERTVWTLVHSGELPHVRVGRRVLVSRTAMESWISTKQTNSTASREAN
jgi:excisionase family DNA binding protein